MRSVLIIIGTHEFNTSNNTNNTLYKLSNESLMHAFSSSSTLRHREKERQGIFFNCLSSLCTKLYHVCVRASGNLSMIRPERLKYGCMEHDFADPEV